jgi:hypothetical protein
MLTRMERRVFGLHKRATGAPAGAERGSWGPASDGARGSAGAKPPGSSWMAVHYVRDDVRRRIRVTLEGNISIPELLMIVDRQASENAWSYGSLVDARGTFAAFKPEEIRTLVDHVAAMTAVHGRRGPIAVVARLAATVASAQMYLALDKSGTPSNTVFWDVSEAERWLDEQLQS